MGELDAEREKDLSFTVEVEGRKYDVDLAKDLSIVQENLGEELTDQPSLYAWWAKLYASARRRRKEAELSLRVFEAQKRREIRLRLGEGEGRVTEKAIESELEVDKAWRAFVSDVIRLAEQEEILLGAKDAVAERSDILRSIGAIMRKEMETDIEFLKEKAAKVVRKKIGGE